MLGEVLLLGVFLSAILMRRFRLAEIAKSVEH